MLKSKNMIDVRHVKDNSEFRKLRAEWNSLLMTSAQNNPFLTHEWLYSWWEAFSSGADLYLLLFYEMENETLVGIFPGYVRSDCWLPPVRRLRLLGSEVTTSDFLDLIVMPGKERVVCQAFLSAIADESALHLVELTDIPDESPLLEELETAVAEIGWRTQQWPAHKLCPVIDLPASWDDFMANLSRSVQKNYQYYRRRLQGQGAFLEIISNQAEMPEALAEFTRLHNSRRHQKQQEGIFSTSARKLFYKEMLQRFTAAGWVELAFLKVVDERVAGVCQFNYGNSIYYYQTGYDVTWEKYSVGFVLNGLLIERAIGAGRSSFEFLRGEERYKYRLGATRNRCLRDIYLKRGSSLGEMYLARRKLSVGCRRLVRQSINCLKSPKSACDI